MARPLVIVESKAKAATFARLLGDAYAVRALPRVIQTLPRLGLGIDTERGFAPDYRVLPSCRRPLAELRAAAGETDRVWLAFDPDAEGERLAQRVAQDLAAVGSARVRRPACLELTRRAVTAALDAAGHVNARRADAQQTRALVDHLIGRALLPLLTGPCGGSSGRLLLAALGLLGTRARGGVTPRGQHYPPTLVTSTLLLEAARSFAWRPQRTLAVAEGLWDGSALGAECGLISFPRGEFPIRPTDTSRAPERLARRLGPDARALYSLVFERSEASGQPLVPGGLVVETASPSSPFTEAELLHELCRLGIARFSADSNLGSLAEARGLIRRDKGRLLPTRQGCGLADWLQRHAPQLVAPGEAAALARRLNAIEDGGETPLSVLDRFWRGLQPVLDGARAERPSFIGPVASAPARSRRVARTVGVSCPRCDGGQLVEREAEGKRFYGCSRFPACRFTCSDRPLAESCPRCGHAYLLVRETRRGRVRRCANEGCRYRQLAGSPPPMEARGSRG